MRLGYVVLRNRRSSVGCPVGWLIANRCSDRTDGSSDCRFVREHATHYEYNATQQCKRNTQWMFHQAPSCSLHLHSVRDKYLEKHLIKFIPNPFRGFIGLIGFLSLVLGLIAEPSSILGRSLRGRTDFPVQSMWYTLLCHPTLVNQKGLKPPSGLRRNTKEARQTTLLIVLLGEFEAKELAAAVEELLQRNTPRAASVAFVLARRHRSANSTLLPFDLSRPPDSRSFRTNPSTGGLR